MNKVKNILVTTSQTIKECLELLEESSASILLLVDFQGKLLRTVTDGDLRRLLVAGDHLDSFIERLPKNSTPIVQTIAACDKTILQLMDEKSVNQIPIVDAEFRPIDLKLRRELAPKIQLSIPHMGEYEKQFVEEAFSTNWIAPLGPNVDAFEEEIAQYVGVGHAAALSSGTAAIHLALKLLGVGRGDTVICSSFTFVASANPILYQDAVPVFIDSEPRTWNMCPVALKRALTALRQGGVKPKAIIVVHLYGQSADMDAIMSLSREFDVPVVEDAAESLGAYYKGKHTGQFGHFGIFSFNGNKIITTSGGGMLISNDGAAIEKARFLSTQARDQASYYEHTEIGYNYRMSNVLAGIGRGQLKVLDERVESRRSVFKKYQESFEGLSLIEWMPEPKDDSSNRWLTAGVIHPAVGNQCPNRLIDYLAKNNVEARRLWKPMHLQPLFKGCKYYQYSENESVCDNLFNNGFCLPSGSNLSFEKQDRVIELIKEYFDPNE